jgi:DNA-directed RNA polymerase omega subunit
MREPDCNDVAEAAVKAAGSKFALVGAVVTRANQLSAGYPPVIEGLDAIAIEKPAMTAIREIAAGAVEVQQSAAKRRKVQQEARAA